jgi:hypothetical protein
MVRQTEAQLIFSLDRPRPHFVGNKGHIWFPEQESMPVFLPETIGLERYYAPIGVIKLTNLEWGQLEELLGTSIPKKYRELIEQAFKHLFSFYCLKDRAPKLSELEERTREIKNACELILKLTAADPIDVIGKQKRKRKSVARGTASHVLSAKQIVSQHLIHALPTKARSMKEYLEPIRILAEICEQALQQIGTRASRHGPKADVGLEYVVIVLVFVAGRVTDRTDFKLLSPTTKTYELSRYPLLAFVREAVALGADKGLAAIERGVGLTPEEARQATNLLNAAKNRNQRRTILDWARKRLLFERKRYG